MEGIPAEAQYADRAADVSPVEAQPTPTTGRLSLRRRLTWLTKTVMPKSLKLPVWLIPQCLTQSSFMFKNSLPKRSAQKRLELPSKAETMSSGSISGSTHSFLLHTPEPYGHVVFPTRESNSDLQYAPSYLFSASMSCWTSRRPPELLRYTISSSEYDSAEYFPAPNGTYLALNSEGDPPSTSRCRRASSLMFSSAGRRFFKAVGGAELLSLVALDTISSEGRCLGRGFW